MEEPPGPLSHLTNSSPNCCVWCQAAGIRAGEIPEFSLTLGKCPAILEQALRVRHAGKHSVPGRHVCGACSDRWEDKRPGRAHASYGILLSFCQPSVVWSVSSPPVSHTVSISSPVQCSVPRPAPDCGVLSVRTGSNRFIGLPSRNQSSLKPELTLRGPDNAIRLGIAPALEWVSSCYLWSPAPRRGFPEAGALDPLGWCCGTGSKMVAVLPH
ncbi:hypothetical protein EGW08_020230 [Elysia chlorotica]|uniref:Uncharacterized protein n=1 Tax=Elysia chlorotica TaxID=188477 RepID=A0A433SRZ0_ELYCH|nr:hypothetical protein EGW08_020230 [Elysia chlorotica]